VRAMGGADRAWAELEDGPGNSSAPGRAREALLTRIWPSGAHGGSAHLRFAGAARMAEEALLGEWWRRRGAA
jgi:hypothetical protein